MRLFTGIEIPPAVLSNLEQLIESLRPAAQVKWCPVQNFHITMKFIGEWPDGKVEDLKRRLGHLPSHNPATVRIRGLGFFPTEKAPRVFWAGVEAPDELGKLARETDLALSSLGVTIEPRGFSPHLTLARIKEPVPPLDSLRERIRKLTSTDFGSFVADRFHLFLSNAGPSGSVYTKLSEFPFAK